MPQLSPATAPVETPPCPAEKSVRNAVQRRRADDVEAHKVEPHDDVLIGMVADHEGIGSLGLEPIFLIEAAGAVVVGEYRQIEMVGAPVAGAVDHPFDQRLGDALPLHFLDHIKLAKLGRLARAARTAGAAGQA